MSINSLASLTTATPIAFGAAATSAGVNSQTRTSGGIEDKLALICGQSTIVGDHTSATNITADANPLVFVNASGGNATVNLPAASANSLQAIQIKKIDQSLDTTTTSHNVAIVPNGSDVIELPWSTLTTPTATQLDLKIPGESVILYSRPSTTYWQVLGYNEGSLPNVYAIAYRTGIQTFGGGTGGTYVKVQLNTESADPFNLYDPTTNYRFTCPVDGRYSVSGSLEFSSSAGAEDVVSGIYVNGALSSKGGRIQTTTVYNSMFIDDNLVLNAGDYIELYAYRSGTVKSLSSGATNTVARFRLINRM